MTNEEISDDIDLTTSELVENYRGFLDNINTIAFLSLKENVSKLFNLGKKDPNFSILGAQLNILSLSRINRTLLKLLHKNNFENPHNHVKTIFSIPNMDYKSFCNSALLKTAIRSYPGNSIPLAPGHLDITIREIDPVIVEKAKIFTAKRNDYNITKVENYKELKFVHYDSVNSMDWLLRSCYAEQENAYKVLEQEGIHTIGDWGENLAYFEVFDYFNGELYPIGLFMLGKHSSSKKHIYGLHVFPIFRNRGYGKIILDWCIENGAMSFSTRNPILEHIAEKAGFKYQGKVMNEYSGVPDDSLWVYPKIKNNE